MAFDALPMKRTLLSFGLLLPLLCFGDTPPQGYSPDLFPVMREIVRINYLGLWGPEPEPPDRFVREVLPTWSFHRLDLNHDGRPEIIIDDCEDQFNGWIYVFTRNKHGWHRIANFEGFGYTVGDHLINGFLPIITRRPKNPNFLKDYYTIVYTYTNGEYKPQKP